MSKTVPAVAGRRPVTSSGKWMEMSASDRLKELRSLRVFGPDAAKCLTRLNARLRGDSPASSGNAGILITGPAHIGKHSLIAHLADSNPPTPTETIDRHSIVVVPPIARPDPGGLTEAIELATGWRYQGARLLGGAGPAFQVNKICQAKGVRILAFDRAMFLCGRQAIAPEAVPFLSGIMDAGQTLVVLVGPKTLEDRIRKTSGLSERFFFWRLAPFAYGDEWVAVLGSYERAMPFAPGSLTSGTMPARLYLACWGKLPRFGQLTIEAARNRLRNRSSNAVIELQDFYDAYAELMPDDRKNPFRKDYTAQVLAEDIERGPRVDAATLTGVE